MELLHAHTTQCDSIYLDCDKCKSLIQKKDASEHASSCHPSPHSTVKCTFCARDYPADLELKHFNKVCEKATECQKCHKRVKPTEQGSHHDCVAYLLAYQSESKRKKKQLQKQNEQLKRAVKNTQKRYSELIKNEGNFCSFCEVPLARGEQ